MGRHPRTRSNEQGLRLHTAHDKNGRMQISTNQTYLVSNVVPQSDNLGLQFVEGSFVCSLLGFPCDTVNADMSDSNSASSQRMSIQTVHTSAIAYITRSGQPNPM